MSKLVTLFSPAAAAGIVPDFDSLYKLFEPMQSVRYTHFLKAWKQKQMSVIYAGQQTDRECREVSFTLTVTIKH